VASAVIGATSRAQLEELLAAAAQPPLGADILEEIEAVHRQWPSPAP
jgi:aryl-alcohol dehydrogenase-like predicted oxidoreductase